MTSKSNSVITRQTFVDVQKKLEELGYKDEPSIFKANVGGIEWGYKPSQLLSAYNANETIKSMHLAQTRFFDTSYVFSPANPAVGYKDPVKMAAISVLIKHYGKRLEDFEKRNHPYLFIPLS